VLRLHLLTGAHEQPEAEARDVTAAGITLFDGKARQATAPASPAVPLPPSGTAGCVG
jgi:hypothetical protein